VARRIAPDLRGEVSAVGGAVRDAMLGLPPGHEIDLVVEGDARPLADRLGRALGARVVSHPRFGTASIEIPHGGRVDLVSARREAYAAPGALPTVSPGTLADDLARRDFSVNAMALRLSGDRAGELVDPYGGAEDLDAGLVRLLRGNGFEEDPSRLVRAARYAARLGFALAPDTQTAGRAAAPALDLGSARVGSELRRLLEEPSAAGALALLGALGVPWVTADPHAALSALDAAAARPDAPDLPRWALRVAGGVEAGMVEDAALPGWARALAREAAAGAALADRLRSAAAPSEVDALLRAAPPATAVGALAAGAGAVAGWWSGDRGREAAVRGADLVRAGVPPGPEIGRALAAVRAAVLDGRVGGADEQLAMALRLARGEA
jgi:tRNA nucleotidyltransferase (CCA-adding enzyme)